MSEDLMGNIFNKNSNIRNLKSMLGADNTSAIRVVAPANNTVDYNFTVLLLCIDQFGNLVNENNGTGNNFQK